MSSLLVPSPDHIPNTRLTSEALVRRRPIFRDVLDAPAHQVAAIIGGTLYTHPQPAPLHTIEGDIDRHRIPTRRMEEDQLVFHPA